MAPTTREVAEGLVITYSVQILNQLFESEISSISFLSYLQSLLFFDHQSPVLYHFLLHLYPIPSHHPLQSHTSVITLYAKTGILYPYCSSRQFQAVHVHLSPTPLP